jgi:hypothetical protein
MRRHWLGWACVLLLASCLGPRPDTAVITRRPDGGVIDGTRDARLTTTMKRGVLLTTARLGGREVGPFVIDSGASALVFDVGLAEAPGLRLGVQREDPHLKQTVRYGALASVDVGPITLRDTSVVVIDLSPIVPGLGERVAGILGYPFFARAIVEIDYPKGSVSCFDPASYRLPAGQWLPLTLKNNQPGVAARLAANGEGIFMLDTGSTATAHLSAQFVAKNPFLHIGTVSRTKALRITGEHDVLTGTIGWFDLAGYRFEMPTIMFSPAKEDSALGIQVPIPRRSQVSDGFDGSIGHGFMRHFTVVFNYSASKVALIRR